MNGLTPSAEPARSLVDDAAMLADAAFGDGAAWPDAVIGAVQGDPGYPLDPILAAYEEWAAHCRSAKPRGEIRLDSGVAPTEPETEPSRTADGTAFKRPPPRKVILIEAGQQHDEATKGEAAIIAGGRPVFQWGTKIVRPCIRETKASDGSTTITAALMELRVHAILDELSRAAEFQKFAGRKDDLVVVNAPKLMAEIILSRAGEWTFPVISGLVTTPTLRPDGSVLREPGYDIETRLFHHADRRLKLHDALTNPTRQDAERALRALAGLLGEFPFVGIEAAAGQPERTVGGAVALSAIVTAVARGALSVAPLHAFRAPAAGSGKSYLADVVRAVAAGQRCPVMAAAAGDDKETEKRLVGELLAGTPLFSVDNVNGELGSDLLCQAIERPLMSIRALGGSAIAKIENHVTVLATGNNLRVRGDMVRRTLVCDLDASMERPENRPFQAKPVATVLGDRGRYVSAALVIVRAYMLAGSPGKLPALASFEHWSDKVRSALVWLGTADPLLSMEAARDDDPDFADLQEIATLWRQAFGTSPMTLSAAVTEAEQRVPTAGYDGEAPTYAADLAPQHAALAEAFRRISGGRAAVDTRRLGYWLRNREGRIVGGIGRFKRAGISHGVVRWAIDAQ